MLTLSKYLSLARFTMKRTFLLSLVFLVGCSSSTGLMSIVPVDKEYPLEIKKDFLATFEHRDLGSTGMRYVAQSGKLFVLALQDDTTGQKAVCDNLEGTTKCVDVLGTTLDEESASSIIRVTVKSVRRLIGREHTLINPDTVETKTPPKDLTLAEDGKVYSPFAQYSVGKATLVVDSCTSLSQNNDTEKESLCYSKNVVAAYTYIQGSSIIPLTISRTLHFFKEQTLTSEEMKVIKTAMVENMKQ